MKEVEIKKEIVKIALESYQPVVSPLIKNGNERALLIASSYFNFYRNKLIGFLFIPASLAEDDTILKLFNSISIFYEINNFVEILNGINSSGKRKYTLEEVYEAGLSNKEKGYKMSSTYILPEKNMRVPFFTFEGYENAKNEQEYWDFFLPVVNEWTDELKGVILYDKADAFGVLKVEKITSLEDAKKILEKEKEKYKKYKAQYPEDVELIENLFQEKLGKWMKEIDEIK